MRSVKPISAGEKKKVEIYERKSTTVIQTHLFIAFKRIPQLTKHCVIQTALYIVVLNTQFSNSSNSYLSNYSKIKI